MNKKILSACILVVVAIFLVVVIIDVVRMRTQNPANTPTTLTSNDSAAIALALTNFGSKLQQVSTSAPMSAAQTAIDANYGAYVTPSLLSQWESDPSEAPGRTVSSPWPDHIAVSSTALTAGVYSADGYVIELTSNERGTSNIAGFYPVHVTFQKLNGSFFIANYGAGSEQNTDVFPLYPGIGVTWSAVTATTTSIGSMNLVGLVTTSQPLLNVTDLSTATDPFLTYYDSKLKAAGWTQNSSLDADGAGSSVRVYVNGKNYIVLSFVSTSIDQSAGEMAPLSCPCAVTLSVFEGQAMAVTQ